MYYVFYLSTVQKSKITILLNYGDNKRFSCDVCTGIIIDLLYYERSKNCCIICTYYIICI